MSQAPIPPIKETATNESVVITDKDARTWGMLLHLSVFAGYVVPLAGLIAPIVIWMLKKEELQGIDQHGKNLINFMISMVIYGVISGILTFVLIGIPLLFALAIVGVVFPIIAAVKANEGVIWKYPLSIKIL